MNCNFIMIIDGNRINNLSDFYDIIETYLERGNCPWGRNLDSLDEIISARFNYTGDKRLDIKEVIWLNSELSKAKLGKEETILWLIRKRDNSTIKRFKKYWDKRIASAKMDTEKTLFEVILEIFHQNASMNLKLQ